MNPQTTEITGAYRPYKQRLLYDVKIVPLRKAVKIFLKEEGFERFCEPQTTAMPCLPTLQQTLTL